MSGAEDWPVSVSCVEVPQAEDLHSCVPPSLLEHELRSCLSSLTCIVVKSSRVFGDEGGREGMRDGWIPAGGIVVSVSRILY